MRAVYIAVIFATTRNSIPSLPLPYLKVAIILLKMGQKVKMDPHRRKSSPKIEKLPCKRFSKKKKTREIWSMVICILIFFLSSWERLFECINYNILNWFRSVQFSHVRRKHSWENTRSLFICNPCETLFRCICKYPISCCGSALTLVLLAFATKKRCTEKEKSTHMNSTKRNSRD